ncbi:hypothetical protein [Parapedobacter lycopersici]|uniref:hypothetical protein n=1 Tax=Parapedobacter lycopersici TaxID=1864939 RepID=UPI00214D6CCD|nr:hypothetical protein [Parapedobacter lycopersici]
MFSKSGFWLFLLGMGICVSCRTVKDASIRESLYRSNCNQRNVYDYTKDELPVPLHEQEISGTLSGRFSHNTLNIANAIGILQLMERYAELKSRKDNHTVANRLEILEIKQEMDNRVNTMSIEISAVSSEMDCEEERTSQVANYLSGIQDERESKLTKGAIVVGALGAILTGGVIPDDRTSNIVGVTSGVGEASLGLMMLFNKESVTFQHQRNALKDVWYGTEVSTIFPPAIWYYLNYHDPESADQKSLRQQIIEKWTSLGQIEPNADGSLVQLYFGEGGIYSSEELNNRADMYDQLESNINLMKQDLNALAFALGKI